MNISRQFGRHTPPQDPKLKGVSLPAGNAAGNTRSQPVTQSVTPTPPVTPVTPSTVTPNGNTVTRVAFERLRDRVSELEGAVEALVAKVEALQAADRPAPALGSPVAADEPKGRPMTPAEKQAAYRARRAAAKGGAS